MTLIEQIITKNKKENLIEKGDKIVVGFSGGPDSVFMTEMLLKLKETICFDLVLVHINHLLRGDDSDGDELFCYEYAKKNNFKIFSQRIDVEGISKEKSITLEEAGREARYELYNKIMKETKSNKIALAHNKDDQIETFMFRLTRGAGLGGLEGIVSKRDRYIRPISEIYKKDILKYLEENNISYRIDKTNFENEFTRNSIRLDLIPFIEQRYNPKFKDKLYNLIEEIRELNNVVDKEVEKFSQKEKLDIDEIVLFPKHIRGRIISNYLYKHNIEVTREKVFSIEKLLNRGGSCNFDLSDEYQLKKEYNVLKIERKKNKSQDIMPKMLVIPGKVQFGDYLIEAEISTREKVNNESFYTTLKIGDTVIIRQRKDGDRIVPTGMQKEKKLKEIFINEKVSKEDRYMIPLVTYNEDIVWIAGIRGNEKYKNVTDDKCVKFRVRRTK